jgi:uncharacterized membrane protein
MKGQVDPTSRAQRFWVMWLKNDINWGVEVKTWQEWFLTTIIEVGPTEFIAAAPLEKQRDAIRNLSPNNFILLSGSKRFCRTPLL